MRDRELETERHEKQKVRDGETRETERKRETES